MYPDISLWLALLFVVGGLVVLAWSADLFIDAASTIARVLGVSPFIIGMVIIGFGTSAPELCVSALSGLSGHSNLSLGNAYGSAIFNIACILGISAVIRPLAVKPAITFVAAPALAVIAVGTVNDDAFHADADAAALRITPPAQSVSAVAAFAVR